MRLCLAVLLLFSSAFAQQPNKLTPREAAEGWLLLFDGDTLFGWTKDGPTNWHVENGIITGEGESSGWLRTDTPFAEYLLKCEFRAGGGESGIYAAGRALPPGRARAAGGVWHTYEVSATKAGFIVTLDGKRIAGGKEGPDVVGPIGLEHTKDNKVEYRSIKMKPLGLKPIFDGKTVNGWHEVKAKNVKAAPVWSVKDGMIHVEHGPGQLETTGQWADFLLQIDVRANAPDAQHHPNSGVFLRGIPNEFWTGYEAQIRNEWKDDDRSQPVDFGTGGIYHYQPARHVVSTDGEFFTMTVTARGRHLAVWVNGFPVSDWTDPNPEGENVRQKEAKLTAGTISLQAHDPTTNLDFKNIRIAAFPAAPAR